MGEQMGFVNRPDLPKGWVWTTIGKVTEQVLKINPEEKPSETFTYVDISAIDNSKNIIIEPKTIKGLDAPSRARQLIQQNDVLVSTVRTYLNNTAIVTEKAKNQVASTGFSVLRGVSVISGKYLYYYCLTNSFIEILTTFQRGVSYPAVRDADVRRQAIPLAPIAEQHRIVAKIEELFTQLDAAEKSIQNVKDNLKRYHKSLFHSISQGHLVEQDFTDEPAKVLLERIAEQRRLQILEEKKASWRFYIENRAKKSGVDYSPQEVLVDFLIETILDEIKPEVVQNCVDSYFSLLENVKDENLLIKKYMLWLETNNEYLKKNGLGNNTLEAQLREWHKFVHDHQQQSTDNRNYVPVLGIGNKVVPQLFKELEKQKNRLQSQDFIKERTIEKPVDEEWKQRINEQKKPSTDGLPLLPNGWCWVTVDQLSAPENHSLAIGPFGSNLKVSDYKNNGVPLVFVRNIRTGDFDNTHYITEEKAEQLRAHQVAGGDILITKMGEPPGDAYLYPDSRPIAVITADCIKWRLSSILEKKFFVYVINSPIVQDQIKGITRGVAQKKVSLDRFRGIAVPLPPLPEQRRIVAELDQRLSVAHQNEIVAETALIRIKKLRQAILKVAFEGNLVHQNTEDEPASLSLERISQEQKSREAINKEHKPISGTRKPTQQRQLALPLSLSDQLHLYEILRSSGEIISPSKLFELANCSPSDITRFFEELCNEIINLKRIIELRPDRTKEGNLEAKR